MRNIYFNHDVNEAQKMAAKNKNAKQDKSILFTTNGRLDVVNFKVFQNIIMSHLCLLDGSEQQAEKFNRSVIHCIAQVKSMSDELPRQLQFSYKYQTLYIQRCLQQNILKVGGNDYLRQALMHPKPLEKYLKQRQVKPLALSVRSGNPKFYRTSIFGSNCNNQKDGNQRCRKTFSRRHASSGTKKYKNSTTMNFCFRNDIEPMVDYKFLDNLCKLRCPQREERIKEGFQLLEELYLKKVKTPVHVADINVHINNVVCVFNVNHKLNLRYIALNTTNVELKSEKGMLNMKLRYPSATATMWASGKITCTGATTEPLAIQASRCFARRLQKLGVPVKLGRIRIVNVLATLTLPFAIRIINFSQKYRMNASYEPELYPGVTYKIKEPKTSFKIFSTGSVTLTVQSVSSIKLAVEHIYYVLYEFQRPRTSEEIKHLNAKSDRYIKYTFY